MRRRSQRERRAAPGGLSLFQRIKALSAGLPLFLASGHITLSGTGDVLSVHDANDDTHVLTQADTAKQVDPPAAHADFANQLCLSFTGAEYYQSNRAASTWSDLHNGVGLETVFPWTPLNVAAGRPISTRATGTTVGFNVALDSNYSVFVHNGTALAVDTRPGGLVNGTPTYVTASYVEGRAPEYSLYLKGTQVSSGNSAAAPSASAPHGALVLGGTTLFGSLTSMRTPALAFFPPLVSATRPTVQQWMLTYGLTP